MVEFNDNEIERVIEGFGNLRFGMLGMTVRAIEDTMLGRLVIERNPDKKLYAVLKPTKDELLQRLRAPFEFADQEISKAWFVWLSLSLPIVKMTEFIDDLYANREITLRAANELSDRLTQLFPWDELVENILVDDIF